MNNKSKLAFVFCLTLESNENIKTFDNLSGHLELEAERLKATKANSSSYIAQSSSRRPFGPKHKKNQGEKNRNSGRALEKANSTKRKKGKHDCKKGKTSTTFFNCVIRKDTSLMIALSQ